ncbi:MAG TPA: tripartite tricarboxylate transporter substrate binding protein [Burkholderiaceae bacterium]|nr:tripartite tricarboxylate transporter substrate binding protein [Burkholderiaceae bacterium]
MTAVTRRTVCALGLSAATAALWAQGTGYPARPVEWVVPYPAGGGTDVVARTLAENLAKSLGQSFVINNKPGAGTNIAADYVARARPDGYTLLTADTATLAANPSLYSRLTYNAERDFTPIGLIGRFHLLLVVNPSVPARNLRELLAWVKGNEGKLNYASPGAGSPHHLAMELFAARIGAHFTHVPYRGAAPAVQDVIGAQVPMMFVDLAAGYPHIVAGRLRVIGVASPQRLTSLPDVPTLAEGGLADFEAYAWQGLVAPAGTPAEVVDKLNGALRNALDSTAVKARFQVLGVEPTPGTPQQMATYAKSERARWGDLIKLIGIRLD